MRSHWKCFPIVTSCSSSIPCGFGGRHGLSVRGTLDQLSQNFGRKFGKQTSDRNVLTARESTRTTQVLCRFSTAGKSNNGTGLRRTVDNDGENIQNAAAKYAHVPSSQSIHSPWQSIDPCCLFFINVPREPTFILRVDGSCLSDRFLHRVAHEELLSGDADALSTTLVADLQNVRLQPSTVSVELLVLFSRGSHFFGTV